MPEWLLKQEEYTPLADRDTFLRKSILSLVQVLARIRAQSGGLRENRFHASAISRVLFTLLLIELLSLSRDFAFVFLVITYLLAVLCFYPAKEIARILGSGAFAALIAAVVLLPSVFLGNRYSIVMLPAKVFAAITAVNILSRSTKWSAVTGALKSLFVPDLFLFVLDITIRYIVMLGELSLELLYALQLRSVGKNRRKYSSLSGVGGTLFLKSREMAEEMYYAMECRGFTGEYRAHNRFRFGFSDFLEILLAAGFVSAYFYLGRG